MLPFELVATATASPRYSPAGSLRKFGTEGKGMFGTPVIVAFCWADTEPAASRDATHADARCRVMERLSRVRTAPGGRSRSADRKRREEPTLDPAPVQCLCLFFPARLAGIDSQPLPR